MGDTGIPRPPGPAGSSEPASGDPPVDRGARDHGARWPEPASAPPGELYYLPLLRLAALLTGDPAAAEAVAADALAAVSDCQPASAADRTGTVSASCADFVARLQREVVTRSRRGRYYHRLAQRRASRLAPRPEFAQLPVVEALRGLRASLREAIVLIHYLDLPTAQAAAIAGISESALRTNLAIAMHALADHLPAT